jgi:hypothetical protein
MDVTRRLRLAATARHAVYGSVIVLAVVIALDDTSVRPGEAIASVVGAALATVLAEVYADYLAGMIEAGRAPTRPELREAFRNATAGLLAAILPVVFFILAAFGVMETTTAFNFAVWTGVGVVGLYAFFANRVGGMSVTRSLVAGFGFTVLGTLLVLLKALVTH